MELWTGQRPHFQSVVSKFTRRVFDSHLSIFLLKHTGMKRSCFLSITSKNWIKIKNDLFCNRNYYRVGLFKTRMHSSRMRIVRCSRRRGEGEGLPEGVCHTLYPLHAGIHTPLAQLMLGYTTPHPVHVGIHPTPVHAGIHTPCPVHAGIHTPAQWMLGYTPSPHPPQPWTGFLTHTCENITFPQLLLWTVTKPIPVY